MHAGGSAALFCTWPAMAIRGPGKCFSKNYYVYKRNLHLKRSWDAIHLWMCLKSGKEEKPEWGELFLSALPETKRFPLAISNLLCNFCSAHGGCDGEGGVMALGLRQ